MAKRLIRRVLGVKKRLAEEFVGVADPDFHTYFPLPATQEKAGYHRIYTPAEIRRARQTLQQGSKREQLLPPVLCVRTPKGGAGKTMLTSNLGSTLAMQGYRVLLIDGDPQASMSKIFGINTKKKHIGDLLEEQSSKGRADFQSAVHEIYPGVLDIVPSFISMASIDLWLVGKPFREGLVKKLFQANADFLSRYDVILVDTAPSTSLLTFSLMVAATNLLVVARLEPQCIETLDQMISNVQELEASGCDQFDIRIIANGVVAPSHPMSDSVESAAVALAQRFPEIIEEKVLSLSPSFVRQVDLYDPSQCGTVIEREPNSMACRQVIDLAKSLARHYKIKLGLDE